MHYFSYQFYLLLLVVSLAIILLGSGMSASGEADTCQDETELQKLCAFVDDTDSWINQTLATLGWTREHVVKVSVFCLDC